jgi:hypothetical protein
MAPAALSENGLGPGCRRETKETQMAKNLRMLLTTAATISALALANAAGATGYDRHVDIVNNSDQAIANFYATNVGKSTWGRDLLGDYVLEPGYVAPLDLDDRTGYCRFDFKTVMDDGTAVIRRNVDVCTIASYTID